MRYTTVLFDLDGTLTDSQAGITQTICQVLAELGRPGHAPAEFLWCVGPQLRDCFVKLLDGDQAQADEAMRLYSKYFEGGNMFINSVYPGALEMLGALRAGGRHVALVSGKPVHHSMPILEHFGIAPLLDGVFGPTKFNHSEDKGWLLHEAMRRLMVSPGNCIYVGDRAGDARGAAAAGIELIAVRYGYGSDDELKSAGAARFADSPAQVVETIADMERRISTPPPRPDIRIFY